MRYKASTIKSICSGGLNDLVYSFWSDCFSLLVLSDLDLTKALMTVVKAGLRAACLTSIYNREGKLSKQCEILLTSLRFHGIIRC